LKETRRRARELEVADEENRDDLILVKLSQKGDNRAFKLLYVRHHRALFAIVRRLVQEEADAEDVVQESFVRAWRALKDFRGETSFKNWLVRIGVNLSRNLHKRRRYTVPLADTPAPSNDSDVLAQEWLDRALDKLPEGYREVLVLHDVMEMRHTEIGEILGLSVGTSKSQLHRARAKMRSLLIAESRLGATPKAGDEQKQRYLQ
jgi:RNA polymerase sigma-70 factor (ECF subfamily)